MKIIFKSSHLYRILLVWALMLTCFMTSQIYYNVNSGRSDQSGRHRSHGKVRQRPLLTLFTSADTSDVSRKRVHENTLVNWAALRPWIRPVLYTLPEDAEFAAVAREAGWDTREVRHTRGRLPIITYLFQDVVSAFPGSRFYGFSNADILFDENLVDTLTALENFVFPDPGILMVGRRLNVPVHRVLDPGLSQSGLKPAIERSYQGAADAQDYFITTADGYRWDEVPEFVLGRPGYDNWLLAQGLIWGTCVVDLSDTVPAIHQSGSDGDRAGWSATDVCVNRDIAGPYDYIAGQTTCATWYTSRDWAGRVAMVQRPWKPHKCRPRVLTEVARVGAAMRRNNTRPRVGEPPGQGTNPCRF